MWMSPHARAALQQPLQSGPCRGSDGTGLRVHVGTRVQGAGAALCQHASEPWEGPHHGRLPFVLLVPYTGARCT